MRNGVRLMIMDGRILLQDQLRSFLEIGANKIGWRREFAVLTSVARADKDGLDPGVLGGLQIDGGIAHEPGLGEIDAKISYTPLDQTDGGLPAIALYFEIWTFAGEAFIRMVRAIINSIQEGSLRAQQCFQ